MERARLHTFIGNPAQLHRLTWLIWDFDSAPLKKGDPIVTQKGESRLLRCSEFRSLDLDRNFVPSSTAFFDSPSSSHSRRISTAPLSEAALKKRSAEVLQLDSCM